MENFYVRGNIKKTDYANPNRFNSLDGAILYILLLVSFLILPYIVKLLMYDLIQTLAAFDTYALLIVEVFISQASIFVICALYCLIRKVNPIYGGGYKIAWDGIHVLMSVILIIGIMMLFYFTHLQLSEYANVLIPTQEEIEFVESPFSIIFAIIYLIQIAIFPAVIEEMAFRGVIMKGFEEISPLFAVICSALMFSLMHGSFNQMLLQFIGGIAIGAVVLITKNFLLGMIMHFVNNAFSTVYTLYITQLIDNPIWENFNAVLGSATIILGVIFVLVGVIYFGSMVVEKEKDKIKGRVHNDKFEKTRRYLIIENGEERAVDYKNPPELLKRKDDFRTFYYYGKNRKLNSSSPKTLTYVLIGVGITFAVICIFFGI